jgi:hypothetical protein
LTVGDTIELSFAKGTAQARVEKLELEKGDDNGL